MKKFIKTICNQYVNINKINYLFIDDDYNICISPDYDSYEPSISTHKSKKEAELALVDLIAWIEEDETCKCRDSYHKKIWDENNQ